MTDTSLSVVAQFPQTLILWDIDHTLIENGGVSKETYSLAFELLTGYVPLVRPATDGRTDFQIMRELLSANSVNTEKYVEITQFEGVLIQAMTQNAPRLPQRGHVLPGVIDALTVLSTAPAIIQSVLTGNIAPNARAKLSAFNLDAWVDVEVGGFGSDDKVRSNLVDAARRKVSKKYGTQFDHSSTILIGDTLLDAWCQVMNAPPASTSLDQECVEDFGRFLPVECLPWTVVEFVGDGVEFDLCVA